MTQNLTKYVNKTILVSIPTLSGNVKCQPYKLTGVELVGLWLQSEQLASEFLAHEQKAQTQDDVGIFRSLFADCMRRGRRRSSGCGGWRSDTFGPSREFSGAAEKTEN